MHSVRPTGGVRISGMLIIVRLAINFSWVSRVHGITKTSTSLWEGWTVITSHTGSSTHPHRCVYTGAWSDTYAHLRKASKLTTNLNHRQKHCHHLHTFFHQPIDTHSLISRFPSALQCYTQTLKKLGGARGRSNQPRNIAKSAGPIHVHAQM